MVILDDSQNPPASPRKRILVADDPAGLLKVREALGGLYDLTEVSTLAAARDKSSSSETDSETDRFDMIICGVHLDESQMFSLLNFIRTRDWLSSLPLIVIQAKSRVTGLVSGMGGFVKPPGACDFVELHNVPADVANKLLQDTVLRCFAKSSNTERSDKRAGE